LGSVAWAIAPTAQFPLDRSVRSVSATRASTALCARALNRLVGSMNTPEERKSRYSMPSTTLSNCPTARSTPRPADKGPDRRTHSGVASNPRPRSIPVCRRFRQAKRQVSPPYARPRRLRATIPLRRRDGGLRPLSLTRSCVVGKALFLTEATTQTSKRCSMAGLLRSLRRLSGYYAAKWRLCHASPGSGSSSSSSGGAAG
jgi:hypothetical protein